MQINNAKQWFQHFFLSCWVCNSEKLSMTIQTSCSGQFLCTHSPIHRYTAWVYRVMYVFVLIAYNTSKPNYNGNGYCKASYFIMQFHARQATTTASYKCTLWWPIDQAPLIIIKWMLKNCIFLYRLLCEWIHHKYYCNSVRVAPQNMTNSKQYYVVLFLVTIATQSLPGWGRLWCPSQWTSSPWTACWEKLPGRRPPLLLPHLCSHSCSTPS